MMPRGSKKKSEMTEAESGVGPIDVHVGARICARRRLLQLSQKDMADRLGITFQQVQKYEKGVNRIGAGRLYSIAQILGVGIDYFFTDIDLTTYIQAGEMMGMNDAPFLREEGVEQRFDPMYGAEATLLLKAFYSMPVKARSALLLMLTSLRDKDDTLDV
jgi:transcriptional regulator with XRE-family HTH domain